MKLILTRTETSDDGTFGKLEGLPFTLYTGELPWRSNSRKISCIPCGTYKCEPYSSPKYSNVYHICNVPGRDGVLIHVGNYCGDRSKGKRSDVEGCIILGKSLGALNRQRAVLSSREAVAAFREAVGNSDFELVIRSTVGEMR